ncbi:hypothetical protein HDU92_001628 [Lobulomyces angularis]|nr:hypothetical protein HDU92_001628 [Lobulomyces angularis]
MSQKFWENRWELKDTPWDKEKLSAPSLMKLLNTKQYPNFSVPEEGYFLVPGCGSGNDVINIFKAGPKRHSIGLDFSSIAIDQALEKVKNSDIDASNNLGKIDFCSGDFFKFNYFDKTFDFVYDYTFFCALEPSLRTEWGKKMAELISDGGLLVTLMFPIMEFSEDGPPYPVSLEAYQQVLVENFELVLHEKVVESFPGRQDRENLAVWKRKNRS